MIPLPRTPVTGSARLARALVRWLVLGGLLAAAGCSSRPAPPAARGGDEVGVAAAVLTTDAAALRDAWRLSVAQDELVAECMRANRLPYATAAPAPEPSAGTVTAEAAPTARPATYGIAVSLAAHGPDADSTGAQDRYLDQLAPSARASYDRAVGGPPDALLTIRLPSGMEVRSRTGGCLGRARERLFGSVEAAIRNSMLPQDVALSFADSLESVPSYRSALSSWKRCMAAAGWNYDSPDAAIRSLDTQAGRGWSPGRLGAEEGKVAAADLACDRRSQLRATRRVELGGYLDRQPASLIEQLAAVRRAREAAVGVAAGALASAGHPTP